jgi:hypothetical protein
VASGVLREFTMNRVRSAKTMSTACSTREDETEADLDIATSVTST